MTPKPLLLMSFFFFFLKQRCWCFKIDYYSRKSSKWSEETFLERILLFSWEANLNFLFCLPLFRCCFFFDIQCLLSGNSVQWLSGRDDLAFWVSAKTRGPEPSPLVLLLSSSCRKARNDRNVFPKHYSHKILKPKQAGARVKTAGTKTYSSI